VKFSYASFPSRVVFGVGSVARVAEEVERLGCRRVLVVSSGSSDSAASHIEERLGTLSVGRFVTSGSHVPKDSVDQARAVASGGSADCVVSVGGGSAIGLAKAVALDGNVKHLSVPTTYSGSEMTSLYGITEDRLKTGGQDDRVRPATVVYDPELTLDLPRAATAGTGMNAVAHCVEGFYGPNRNPVSSALAEEGLRALGRGLSSSVANPKDLEARTTALYGAHVAGIVLAVAGMALHHRICHVLGGSFGLSHGDANAVMLPYVVAFNQPAVPEEMDRVAAAVGQHGAGTRRASDPAHALRSLADALGAPATLGELGIGEEDLDEITRLLVERRPFNPTPVSSEAARSILQHALEGRLS
jgi:maleylacetate reductase